MLFIVIQREIKKNLFDNVSDVINEVDDLKGELVLIVSGNDEIRKFELI